MSKIYSFRVVLVVFLVSFVGLLIADRFIHVSIYVYILLTILFLVITGLGSSNIASGFHLKAICSGNTDEKKIAITFDDGPVANVTPKILDVLKTFQVPATFFCIGKRISGNEVLLRRIAEEGHIIGNHTFSHAYLFDFYPASTVIKELTNTNELIAAVIHRKPRYFRPPYGVTNPAIRKAMKQTGFEVIGWNKRSLDTIISDEQKIFNRTIKDLKGGDVILFHDIHLRTVNVLKQFLQYSTQNGFKIVSLDELIKKQAYEN